MPCKFLSLVICKLGTVHHLVAFGMPVGLTGAETRCRNHYTSKWVAASKEPFSVEGQCCLASVASEQQVDVKGCRLT